MRASPGERGQRLPKPSTRRKRGSESQPDSGPPEDCVIPPPIPPEALGQFQMRRYPEEERAISEYVEWQAPDERVLHAEKVASEHIFGQVHDAWDVHTDAGRWWVITGPTNLYSQALMPSLDYTLSFHIGLMARVRAHEPPTTSPDQLDRFMAPWRRLTLAREAAERAEEAEDFQSVGLRCRECLLEFVRAASHVDMVPAGQEQPQRNNFVKWSELIADYVAPGPVNERLRSYLKAISLKTWQLVSDETHSTGAARFDAVMALDATEHVLTAFGMALIRKERGVPDRCPRCGSYKIATQMVPAPDRPEMYETRCQRCGWKMEDRDPTRDTGTTQV